MKTLEDAVEGVLTDPEQYFAGIADEVVANHKALLLLLSISSSTDGVEMKLLRAFAAGVCIGIEMEKS